MSVSVRLGDDDSGAAYVGRAPDARKEGPDMLDRFPYDESWNG